MILFCNCAYAEVIPAGTKRAVLDGLNSSGIEFTTVADFCELAARQDPLLKSLAAESDLVILACFPRAVTWLFHAGGAPLTGRNARVLNMRAETAKGIVGQLAVKVGHQETKVGEPVCEKGNWIPWFPVIDYARCKNCKQCLSFCLFGVYAGTEDGKVAVKNPRSCKTNCPACARICPEIAIMFPKYGDSPINGGEILDESAERANVKVSVEQILGNDPYRALAERKKKRQLLIRERDKDKAVQEREAHTGGK